MNCMITVDCSEVLPIQHEMLIYVSDDIGAIPTVKRHEFVLSPIEDDETVDQVKVTTSIREYLDSIGQGKNFGVISKSETIFIKSINGEKMSGQAKPVKSINSCCGL